MTNTKTPEERAEEYEKLVHMADFKELNPSQLEAYLALDRKARLLCWSRRLYSERSPEAVGDGEGSLWV